VGLATDHCPFLVEKTAVPESPSKMNRSDLCNLGVHISNRLVEVGCTDAFAVAGDFNLLLLDQLLKNDKLNMVIGILSLTLFCGPSVNDEELCAGMVL
jgi:hypothetical protein